MSLTDAENLRRVEKLDCPEESSKLRSFHGIKYRRGSLFDSAGITY